MSTNTIQMYVNIKKNNVSTSTGFGKYYLNADTNETLSNDGLVNHIMHHNCAVGREAIAEGSYRFAWKLKGHYFAIELADICPFNSPLTSF